MENISSKESERTERFRLLAEEVEEYAIYFLDVDGHVTSWNLGAEKIKGYSKEEILGRHVSIFYTDEDIEAGRPEEGLAAAAREGEWTDEGWRVRKDGSRFWARVTITSLRKAGGELRGFAKVTRDLTKDRRQEEELERQNALLNLMQRVASAANRTDSFEEVLQMAVRTVCEQTDWAVGQIFRCAESTETEGDKGLTTKGTYSRECGARFDRFTDVIGGLSFGRGEGLPGRALETGRPAWSEDLAGDLAFPEAEAAEEAGIKGACAFPVPMEGEPRAVLTFYSEEVRVPGQEFLNAMESVCMQLGRVAEREEDRRSLEVSEERYRRLFEDAQEGIAIVTPDGYILDANPAAIDIFGYSWSELQSMRTSELYVNPDDRTVARQELQENGRLRGRELHLKRADGEEIVCRLSATAHRTEDGEPTVYQVFFRDVTERVRAKEALEESEEKFRKLAEEALVGIGLIQDGTYEYVNPALLQITGYSRDELLGASPKVFIHPADWPKAQRQVEKREQGEVEQVHYEVRVRTKAGETRRIEVAGSRIDYQGEPAVIGTIQDVTERRELQRDILQVQQEERRRMGKDLHDGVASQLTGVSIILSALRAKIEGEHPEITSRIQKALDLVQESGEDLRRVSRGLNPVALEEGGLLAALERLTVNTEGCKMEQSGTFEGLSQLSSKEEAHLYWIAQEAVANAHKYAEGEGIVLRLHHEENTDAGEAFILEVEDDGSGFDVSDPMHEGLGLRTMKYRAELLNAELTIDSAPGEGTLVRCRLSR